MTLLIAPTDSEASYRKNLKQAGVGFYPEIVIAPRRAGRPDPRWQVFDWRHVERRSSQARYRLFFYEAESWAARFVDPIIGSQISELTKIFGVTPQERFDYVLFTSLSEFRQANIFDISEGVRGVTSTEDATMAVPFAGDVESFMHVSKHELVHQFQVQKARIRAGQSYPSALGSIPLWFVEGMAEFHSLKGLDREAQYYLRDLLLNEDQKEKYSMPGFFETGPMSFVFVYKLGQAKIHFLEKEFGQGKSQEIYEKILTSDESLHGDTLFEATVVRLLGIESPEIEKRWRKYIDATVRSSAEQLPQTLELFKEVHGAGQNLDHFRVSPNGKVIAIREVDTLTGRASLSLLDPVSGRKITVAKSLTARIRSLYFLQAPVIALSDSLIAYAAETIHGPVIEWRTYTFQKGHFTLGSKSRINLNKKDILQASSLALKEDGRIAFVGLSSKGWPDIFVGRISGNRISQFKKITDDPYLYENLKWVDPTDGSLDKQFLVAETNRWSFSEKSLIRINPSTGEIGEIRSGTFTIQSWQSGSSQIHFLEFDSKTGFREHRLTGVKTWLGQPEFVNGKLFALGFKSGRFRLYEIPESQRLFVEVPRKPIESNNSWKAELSSWGSDEEIIYSPFKKGNWRVDRLGGYLSTGGISGIQGIFSDLMRDYQVSTEVIAPDNPNFASVNLFLSSRRGRSVWTAGAYRVSQPRLDKTFGSDGSDYRTFIRSEWGGFGRLRYPFSEFAYFDFGARLAKLNRSDFSDPALEKKWRELNPESEFFVAPAISVGYDNVLYELVSGPLEGFSLLLQAETDYFPARGLFNKQFRFDGSTYFRIYGTTLLALEAIAAASIGGAERDSFLLSGDDILRAYIFGDPRLIGAYVASAKAEIRFPLGRLFNFQNLRGLLHYDYGSVADSADQLNDRISSSYGAGFGFSLPPVSINLVWAWPIQTVKYDQKDGLPYRDEGPVFHFSLRYLYF